MYIFDFSPTLRAFSILFFISTINIILSVDKSEFTYFISGGMRVPHTDDLAKYMVSIRSRQPTRFFGDNHFCAGAIINQSWVLTAAHCVMDKAKMMTHPRALTIVAGTPNRLKKVNTTILMPVRYIRSHPNYTMLNINNIALIRLKGELPLDNERIKILKLPNNSAPYGTSCTALGWGRMYFNGPLAASLWQINVSLYLDNECKKYHPEEFIDMLCAGDREDVYRDACRGDTGGPLICNNEATGIMSITLGCEMRALPIYYTDVYKNLAWIQSVLSSARRSSKPTIICLYFILVVILSQC